jgi:hypothetical protein
MRNVLLLLAFTIIVGLEFSYAQTLPKIEVKTTAPSTTDLALEQMKKTFDTDEAQTLVKDQLLKNKDLQNTAIDYLSKNPDTAEMVLNQVAKNPFSSSKVMDFVLKNPELTSTVMNYIKSNPDILKKVMGLIGM